MGGLKSRIAELIGVCGQNEEGFVPFRSSFIGTDTLTHAPAANTAAVVTLAGVAGSRRVVAGVAWSYDADPTGGALTIASNGVTIFQIDITGKGPGFIPFRPGIAGAYGLPLAITLTAGGAAVTGKVNVLGTWIE